MWFILGQLLLVVALTIIVAALSWRKQQRPDDGLDEFTLPRAKEGSELPKIFGTVTVKSPQVAWYGDKRASPIVETGGRKYGLFGPKSKTTIGYKYSLGIHFVVALGPVDSLRRISYDERTAWLGSSSSGRLRICKPTLFGKADREGGIEGIFTLRNGSQTQGVVPYLQDILGSPQPAYRGVMSVVFERMYLGNQPSVRPVSFRVSRINSVPSDYNNGEQWYSEKASIFQRLVTEEDEPQKIYIAIDLSGSMAGARLANAKAATVQALEFLRDQSSGRRNSIRIVGWSDTINASITRNNITSAQYNDLISFVNGLAIAGGTNFEAPFADANSFFGVSLCESRRMLFITDGEPFPPETLAPAQAIYNSFQNVAVLGVAVDILINSAIRSVTDSQIRVDSSSLDQLFNAVLAVFSEFDMNPVHILRELILSPDTGGSGNENDAGDSWVAAADVIYDEEFGISDAWGNTSNRSQFKERIERHIDARVYQDRRTGLWEIKLIRNDYDPDELHVFDSSNVIAWEDLNFPQIYNLPNQITVTFTDPARDEPGSITLTDPARVLGVGRVINDKSDYSGIQKMSLASRVALRDLIARSTPLITGTIVVTELPLDLNLGSPIKLHYPRLAVENRIVRILEINEGDGRDNSIRIRFVEDRFSLGEDNGDGLEFIVPTPPERAQNIEPRLVEEASYVSVLRAIGEIELTNSSATDPNFGLAHVSAGSNNGGISALINIQVDGSYEEISEIELVASGTTLTELQPRADRTSVLVYASRVEEMSAGDILSLGQEIVRLVSIEETSVWTDPDPETFPEFTFYEMIVERGCIDTVPQQHDIGSTFVKWSEEGVIEEPFTDLDETNVKMRTVALNEVLDLEVVPEDLITFNSRILRPYPPGNLLINAQYQAGAFDSSVDLTWEHRNRITQGQTILSYISTGILSEDGVTYSVRGYAVNSIGVELVEIYSTTGLTGTSLTVDEIDLTASIPEGYAEIIWEVWSVRDGLESWQRSFVKNVMPPAPPFEEGVLLISSIDELDQPTAKGLSGTEDGLLKESP